MGFCGNILLKIYQIFSVIILPFLYFFILHRKKKFKEHPHRFLERFAITKIAKP